jgi:serine protease Do
LFNFNTKSKIEQKNKDIIVPKKLPPIKINSSKKKNVDLPRLISKVKKSIVLVKTYDAFDKALATGTGFAFKKKGIIVTNRHVVAGSSRVEVKINDTSIPVNGILGVDAKSDIVLLSISNTKKINKLLRAGTAKLRVGEEVFVVGNPLGFESTVSTGIISAIRTFEPFGKVIQITSPISPGSSGSPVFNRKGEVVGIATFVAKSGQNLNFSIPIANVNKIVIGKKNNISNLNKIDLDYFASLEMSVDKGEYMLENKEYNNALPYFKKAFKEEPKNTDIKINIGICYRSNLLIKRQGTVNISLNSLSFSFHCHTI